MLLCEAFFYFACNVMWDEKKRIVVCLSWFFMVLKNLIFLLNSFIGNHLFFLDLSFIYIQWNIINLPIIFCSSKFRITRPWNSPCIRITYMNHRYLYHFTYFHRGIQFFVWICSVTNCNDAYYRKFPATHVL